MLVQVSMFLAQTAEPAVDAHWTTDPQVRVWLLGAGFVIAAVAAFYLYKAQRKVATRRAIVALTCIRTALILLVFLMLLGLGRVFSRTGKSDGTLWLMLDQSESMDRADKYATDTEKLRWADALGLFPAELRTSALDRQAAHLAVLQADLLYYQTLTGQAIEEKDAKGKLDEMVRSLKKWNALLTTTADAIEKDPGGQGNPSIGKLRTAADTAAHGIEKLETRSKPEEGTNDLPWNDLRGVLNEAIDNINKVADKSDKGVIARGDERVADALKKVGEMTRADLARQVIDRKSKPGESGFDELMPKQKLKLLGFGETPQVMIPEDPDHAKQAITAALAKPAAPVTDIAGGLQSIGSQVGQGEPATVVIVSDGRQNRRDADSVEAIKRLTERGVRVYSLALGSSEVAPDAAVENIDAPDWVFKGDMVKVTALLRFDGKALMGKDATVELHRIKDVGGVATDTTIDTKHVTVRRDRDVVTFTEKPESLPEPGLYDYQVVIKPMADEAVTSNNAGTVRVAVKDDQLHMLMIEDQPRWEFRYLAGYLSREKRVKLQTMLLQPAHIGYDPDPSKNIAPPPPRKPSIDVKDTRQDFEIFPGADKSPKMRAAAKGQETEDDVAGQNEWNPWQVIIIGDVPPEKIPLVQQKRIVKAVRNNGATLLILSGPLSMPAAWGTSKQDYPLAELFPCDPSPEWTPNALATHLKVGYHPMVAPDGEGHLLTQFGLDEQQNQDIWRRIQTDPNLAWYWHSEYTQAKGGASVIWSLADNDPNGGRKPAADPQDKNPTALEMAQKRALLVTMNAGLGKVLYLSADATWRLRQVNGDNYHERFWGQVVRWAVGTSLPAGGQYVKFGSDKPRYIGGEQAIITAQVKNKSLAPQGGLKIIVHARALSANGQTDPSAKAMVEAEMSEVPEAPGQYQAVVSNLPGGRVELTLHGAEVEALLNNDPKALQKSLNVEVVKNLNLELKNINSDFRTLASLSAAGGGVTLNGAYASVLAEHIPDLNYTTTSAEQIGLFTDPKERYAAASHWTFMCLFVGLMSAEWIIRKRAGLV